MRNLEEREICLLKKKITKQENRNLRVAIYARKSAEDERQTSLDTQIAQCRAFVSQYEFLEITHEFAEDNVSGMFIDGRNEYLAMMSLAERKEIDVIVIAKLDRLARDMANALMARKLLDLYGCYLIAGDDVANADTPAGEFMRNILLSQNQYHARRTASDVMASECNNVKRGTTAGGKPPYGLKVVDKQFLIDEDEAPAVKLMFEMTANGNSYKQVIDKLSSLGYTTRAGKKFSYSTLNSLLRNDKFYGTYVYNRIGGKRKKNRVIIEHFDEVRNTTAIPPIITKQLFDTVQEILAKRSTVCRPKQNASRYLLTGLVFCGKCGHAMTGATCTGGKNKQRMRTYVCSNHIARNGKTCTTKPLNADYLEGFLKHTLTQLINEYLASNDSQALFDGLQKQLAEEQSILLKQIQIRKAKIGSLLEKSASPSTSKILAPEYEKQATELLEAQNVLQAQYNEKCAQIARILSIKNCFSTRQEKLTEEELFASDDTARELFRIFVKRIEVDDTADDIQVMLNGD